MYLVFGKRLVHCCLALLFATACALNPSYAGPINFNDRRQPRSLCGQYLLSLEAKDALASKVASWVPFLGAGAPFGARLLRTPVDQTDLDLWNLSARNNWNESGAWTAIAPSGEVLLTGFFRGELASIDGELMNERYGLFVSALKQKKISPDSVAAFRFRHTHPGKSIGPDFEPISDRFSPADIDALRYYRQFLDEGEDTNHIVLEAEIIFNNDGELKKKGFLLLPKVR